MIEIKFNQNGQWKHKIGYFDTKSKGLEHMPEKAH